ncbi:hypothetical protein RFI_01196 [Reticulomyxa filosa]|uniref:Uncharacterized protein n=1 Tax=Reticulomyxa filosa TaxID=46433 RepID=X6PBI0_RETFI|nr:hypothetical protein RFI_01196 [Reticulomyxa filosa]|eukprot:ETO35865.1 hypothetical protein RFI_01196 [Reticulomyxa filosa]
MNNKTSQFLLGKLYNHFFEEKKRMKMIVVVIFLFFIVKSLFVEFKFGIIESYTFIFAFILSFDKTKQIIAYYLDHFDQRFTYDIRPLNIVIESHLLNFKIFFIIQEQIFSYIFIFKILEKLNEKQLDDLELLMNGLGDNIKIFTLIKLDGKHLSHLLETIAMKLSEIQIDAISKWTQK